MPAGGGAAGRRRRNGDGLLLGLLLCLENSSKRQLSQHVGGRVTHVRWGDEKLVFPIVALDSLRGKLPAASF